jgi:hypothetical protein
MRFIGFSTSLTWNAPGHYLPVHSALNNEFRRINKESIYIGGDITLGNQVWWIPWAPKSLRTRPNFVSIQKVKQLRRLLGSKQGLVVDYEGRLGHILLFAYLIRNSNSQVILNFHYTSELIRLLNSTFGVPLFKLLIDFSNKTSNNKLIYTTESDQLSNELKVRTGFTFPAFPAFSVLEKPTVAEKNKWKDEGYIWLVCRIKEGSPESYALEKLLLKNPKTQFLVHGLTESLEKRFSKFRNVRFQELFVDLAIYRECLLTCSSLILIYDTEMYRNHSSGRLLDSMMFEKKVVVLKGMPIPEYAQASRNIKIVGLPEISNLELNSKKHDSKSAVSELPFFPDAQWAVQELVRISRTTEAKTYRRPLFANGILHILWSFSLVTRVMVSVYLKFTRLCLRFTLLAKNSNQR